MSHVNSHLAQVELSLLEAGGVDNWNGYGFSLEDIEDYGEASADEILYALNSGGVDNWEWYGESLEGFNDYREFILTEHKDSTSFPDFHTWLNQQGSSDL